MNRSLDVLRAPLTLASGAVLPNRLIKAAMSEILADLGTGAPTEGLVRIYERWGRSGAAALITGNVMIDRDATGEPGQVVVVDDRHLAMLRRWAEAGRAGGASLWMQINHAGRQSPRRLSRDPVAPSAVPMRGFFGAFKTPRALEAKEIEGIVARFATTAAVARTAGFDGVEIHAAHGYLISQFLSPLTNLRDDEWGGDAARRRRFLIEVVRAVRAATAPTFTIAVKLNSADFQRGGFEVGEAKEVALALEAEGIDFLEISGGTYERPAMTGATMEAPAGAPAKAAIKASTAAREAYFLEYATQLRTATRLPLMLTGGLRSAAAMAQAVASGDVDLVGLARPMAYQPELPARLLDGSAEAAAPISFSTGVQKLDGLAGLSWYQHQMARLAAGQDPDASLGGWGALWIGLRHMFRKLPRRPDALPAPAVAEAG
jgi:2,4-dienoyl-CoA reductase-like NADH-dependent reductase (Old Yellow Enzyme family)